MQHLTFHADESLLSPLKWSQFIYLFTFRKNTQCAMSTDRNSYILNSYRFTRDNEPHVWWASSVREWRALKRSTLTAWPSLCHVNRPGIKGPYITHPCGSAMVLSHESGAAATVRSRPLCPSYGMRGPHWNVFHRALEPSLNTAGDVRA